jgi:hypothetical protein
MKKSLFLVAISLGIAACLKSCDTAKKGTKYHGKAIIHGSPDQEKLDSLKTEKLKGKS